MSKKIAFCKEEDAGIYEKLNTLNKYLQEIIALDKDVKKLTQHPIKDWAASFSEDLNDEMIYLGHLMLGEKEINELYSDFKNSKNTKLKNLVLKAKILSDQLVMKEVDSALRMKYLKTHKTSTKDLSLSDLKNLKYLRSL